MIRISIPRDHIPERVYAIHILLYEYLGLPYYVSADGEVSSYRIEVENGGVVEVADAFFGSHSAYLTPDNVPASAPQCETPELDAVQLIYGQDSYSQSEGYVACGVDIFASAFFMLTRWEELVLTDRDQHDRFPGHASLAVRSEFILRPVVNEYSALLKKMLIRSGVDTSQFKSHAFKTTLTVDVDHPSAWFKDWRSLRKIAGTAYRTGSFGATVRKAKAFGAFIRRGEDEYNTFDLLMDLAESQGELAHFYFMVGGSHEHDPGETLEKPEVALVLDSIRERGHMVGIHPSYASVEQPELFLREAARFEETTGKGAEEGRQHYLRTQVPHYWRLWEHIGARWESSMCYPESVGFRCGTCLPFSVFDVLQRRMLNLVERPLLIMDVTLKNYMDLSPSQAILQCRHIKASVEMHRGEFLVLWHNSSFGQDGWEGYDSVLTDLMKGK